MPLILTPTPSNTWTCHGGRLLLCLAMNSDGREENCEKFQKYRKYICSSGRRSLAFKAKHRPEKIETVEFRGAASDSTSWHKIPAVPAFYFWGQICWKSHIWRKLEQEKPKIGWFWYWNDVSCCVIGADRWPWPKSRAEVQNSRNWDFFSEKSLKISTNNSMVFSGGCHLFFG